MAGVSPGRRGPQATRSSSLRFAAPGRSGKRLPLARKGQGRAFLKDAYDVGALSVVPPRPPLPTGARGAPVRDLLMALVLLAGACAGGDPPGGPGPGAGAGGSGGGAAGAPGAGGVPGGGGTGGGSAGAGAGAGAAGGAGGAAADGGPAVPAPDAGPAMGPFPLAAVRAARAERLAAVSTHTEGPSWRDGDVFFASDGNGLMRLSADGRVHRYHPQLAPVGSYLLADGSLLVCEKKYIVVQVFRDGKVGVIVGEGAGPGFCNDLAVDAAGNIYFTDAHAGIIYRVQPTGEMVRVVSGRNYPNGVEIDPASKTLYFSTANDLWRIALPAPGAPATFPAPQNAGGPGADGMAFDVWGNLWLAVVARGQLAVFDPARRQVIVSISAGGPEVTNLAFGGLANDVVYTTLSGRGVWKIPVGARGFLHPGAPKYAIKRMLDLVPVAN